MRTETLMQLVGKKKGNPGEAMCRNVYVYTQGGEPKNALPDAARKVRPSQLKSAVAVKSWQHQQQQKHKNNKNKKQQ